MDITAELTIVIPVRIDSMERKDNLDTVLSYLLTNTHAAIIVLEADSKQQYMYTECDERVKCLFIEDIDPIFHRTRYLNDLLRMSETDIVGVWDTDVILDTRQIRDAVNIVNNGVTLCYPYDGTFIFLDSEQRDKVRKDITSFLEDNTRQDIEALKMGRPSVGGVFIVNKLRYLEAGGENENFYGWGPEDVERLKRMEILQEFVQRVQGPVFHLHHPRGVNSTFGHDERDVHNVRELIKVCSMNKSELLGYVSSWAWTKKE
ncbi:galactosyltransferase-related protein [Proteiniphilum sp.]|uniref:galactosyltransferase-related protein n=1 Tax=Proteiniphilum sp. TaxID=1926877 RepID=UPI003331AAE7